MRIEDIRPRIRFADKLEYTAARALSKTYDSRMLYIISGGGSITVDGQMHPIEAGLLIVFQGGTAYSFSPEPAFSAFAVDFDLIGEYDVSTGFLAPVPPRLFDGALLHKSAEFENSTFLSSPLVMREAHGAGAELRALVEEYTSARRFARERAELMLSGLLLDLERQSLTSSKTEKCCAAVLDYIAEHYAEEITNASLARTFGHDPCYLGRLVKQHTGTTIHSLLIKKRVEMGIKLLLTSDMTLDVIAEKIGFCSAAHFSRRCRSVTGSTPSYYRKNRSGADAPSAAPRQL